jgi:hypothetical protein
MTYQTIGRISTKYEYTRQCFYSLLLNHATPTITNCSIMQQLLVYTNAWTINNLVRIETTMNDLREYSMMGRSLHIGQHH